jgi:hypothetical protein
VIKAIKNWYKAGSIIAEITGELKLINVIALRKISITITRTEWVSLRQQSSYQNNRSEDFCMRAHLLETCTENFDATGPNHILYPMHNYILHQFQ